MEKRPVFDAPFGRLRRFFGDESGATPEWVVITSHVTALGLVLFLMVHSGTGGVVTNLGNEILSRAMGKGAVTDRMGVSVRTTLPRRWH